MKDIKFIHLLLFFLLIVFRQGFSQTTGDHISNPIEVGTYGYTPFMYTDTKNTTDYTNQYMGQPTNDVYYRFTTTAVMNITICHCGSGISNTYLHILDSSGNRIFFNDNNSSGCTSTTAQAYLSISNLAAGTYYVVSEGNSGNGNITTMITGKMLPVTEEPPLPFPDVTPSADRNYIRTKTARTLVFNPSQLTTENSMQTVRYFDGLGRPVETVQAAASPGRSDIITYREYDSFGREGKSWLPARFFGTSGAFRPLDVVQGNTPGMYDNDARPFNEPVYESSPLNRMEELRGPGDAWNTHPVKTEYKTNTSSGVLSCNYYALSGNNLVQSDVYSPNELYVVKTTDEDNHESYEFTDKQGRTVLQRQLNEGENYDTYYVYDDYGNLRYVLPPLCVDAANLTEGIEKYGYVYKYDHRNRCIEKKLPGAQAIHYVYDKANRLILSQDGVQRASNEWTFHKYDRLGRLILSGTKTIAQNRASLANTYANLLIVETRGNAGSLVYRYTNTSTLSVTGQEVKLVNYYDNYIPGVLSPNSLGAPCGQSFSSSQGLLTGTISKVYNTTPVKEISTNYYYTYRGELSAEYSSNMANGSDYEFYEYNMPYGELNRKCLRHYGGDDDGLLLPENYEYHYDHAGRMTQKFYSTNEEESPVLMASYEYNPLGQLKSKNTGGVETTTYQYNIRGWLTHLSGQRFSEILSYEGLFGGNIASVTWSIPFLNNQVIHRYDYTYDDLNRMTQALYTGGGSRNYASTFTYDKHGNPLTITRNGRTSTGSNYTFGLIDHLSMNYNGNRLINVDESINNQLSNDLMEFKKKTGNEQGYTYNANGNLTKDLYKKISNIQYNSLNLPNRININGSVTYYCYDAAGVKCQEIHETSTSPYSSTTTVYGGNVIYENGELSKAITEEGFYNVGGDLYYYLRDHLGNNRVAVNSQYDQVSETNNYYPYGMSFAELMLYAPVDVSRYKYNGKELDKMYGLNLYDYGTRMYDPAIGRFTTMDPMAEKYYSVSPYAYCLNNPVKYVDPDGRKIKIANNYAGAMENVAKIAATSLGSQVMNHLIGRDETYTLNSTFWSTSSSYDPSSLDINYVGDPWYNEIPYDGGALNSMVAMGHETFHAFDHSNNVFNSANAGYSKDIAEPRAVSFGNYLRSSYSLSPLREKYGSIQGNFHQFSGSDKISDFTTLGNNADKTSYGFSYTKTTTKVESHKTIAGIKIPDKKSTTSTTYYMTVSRDKNNNASLQIYNNEDEYKKATSNW